MTFSLKFPTAKAPRALWLMAEWNGTNGTSEEPKKRVLRSSGPELGKSYPWRHGGSKFFSDRGYPTNWEDRMSSDGPDGTHWLMAKGGSAGRPGGRGRSDQDRTGYWVSVMCGLAALAVSLLTSPSVPDSLLRVHALALGAPRGPPLSGLDLALLMGHGLSRVVLPVGLAAWIFQLPIRDSAIEGDSHVYC